MSKSATTRAAAPAAVVVAAILTGCAHQVVELMPPMATYSESVLGYGVRNRDIRAIVIGHPRFGGKSPSNAELERAITASMTEALRPTLQTHITTTPGPEARDNYNVVMAFSGGEANAVNLCKTPEADGDDRKSFAVSSDASLRIDAAFCLAGEPVTAVAGWTKGVSGADDPRLLDLVAAVTMALFPALERTNSRGDNGNGAIFR